MMQIYELNHQQLSELSAAGIKRRAARGQDGPRKIVNYDFFDRLESDAAQGPYHFHVSRHYPPDQVHIDCCSIFM
jgi:hypothetical protein